MSSLADETPLDRLAVAIQDFVNDCRAEDGEPPVLLRGAVVAWESMLLDDDGDAAYAVDYAITESMSMAASVGALRLALAQVEQDCIGSMRGD